MIKQKSCLLICAVAVSEVSVAGGFALIEQGASGLGNAYAGAAAVSRDASTVWFNPAGMSELKETQFLAAGHVINVNSDFTDRGTTLNNAFGGGFVDPDFGTAGETGAGVTTGVPNLYLVQPLRGGFTIGVGFSVPFGNSSDYDSDWVGRYQATESSVAALDLNPSISYLVNENLSIGGGISIQYIDATLESAYDTGATCLGLVTLGSLPADACVAAGVDTAGVLEQDGLATVEGDDTSYSFNLGLLYKPRPGTKFGVSYRHGIEHELEGTGEFINNPAFQTIIDAGLPLFSDTTATAEADLPGQVMLSVAHHANDQIELLADATYTNWSTLEELRVVFDGLQPDTFNTFDYEDVWRYSLGFNFKYSDQITIRGGFAYDEDPVPSVELRTARIPGNDRTWFSFGFGYEVNKNIGLDFGYTHVSVDDTPIANVSETAGGTTLRGEFDTNANIFSAQINVQL